MKRFRGFSWTPYKRFKQEQSKIQEIQASIAQDKIKKRQWIIQKNFNENAHLEKWEKNKKKHEKKFTELALSSISVVDAINATNEVLQRGLSLKEAAIDPEAVDDLAYNIYLVKLAEIFCGDSAAALTPKTKDLVIQMLCAQIFPPALPQKPPPSSAKGDELINKLLAIKNSRQ